jgi:acyl dehydratase
LETEDVIDRFSITWPDQERFARLSGDWNPIHTDRDFARRSTFGDAVVHGMNTVLTALERYLAAASPSPPVPVTIAIQFPRPVFTTDALRLVRVSQDSVRLRLAVRSGDTDLVKITLGFRQAGFREGGEVDPAVSAALPSHARQMPRKRAAVDRSMQDGDGLVLELPLAVDAGALAASFPGAIGWLGERRVATIALLSTVVGMEWPGLRSLFTEAKIHLLDTVTHDPDVLTTRVLSADVERGLTTAETSGPGILAETGAFFRPAPVIQPTTRALKDRVAADAFSGWTAVVIGGSRGLGEIAAKLMAAGSADVTLTYRSGRPQAEAVQADIIAAGGRCTLLAHDVAEGNIRLLPLAKPDGPVLLFYAASPHIFRRRTQAFSRPWLDEFLTIYVDGFIHTLQAVKSWTSGPISILYPSSEALDQPMAQLVEYAAAKAAGEAACRSLAAGDKRITADMPRLPRLLTDQTNSIIHVETANPVDVLLPILMRLTKARGSALPE